MDTVNDARHVERGAIRSVREVARIMTDRGMPLSKSRVTQIEQMAFKKLRNGLSQIAADMGVIDESEPRSD